MIVQWLLAMLLACLKFLTLFVLSVNRWMKNCQATAAETALAGMVWTEVLSQSPAFRCEHLVRFALWYTDMAKHLTLWHITTLSTSKVDILVICKTWLCLQNCRCNFALGCLTLFVRQHSDKHAQSSVPACVYAVCVSVRCL